MMWGYIYIYINVNNFWNLVLPRVCSLQNFVLDLVCCAVFFHHIFPFALDVKISMYGHMHGRASCAGEPCFSAGTGRRGQETMEAPHVLEARLLQLFDRGGRRCRRRPLQGALMAGHGLNHSVTLITFF